MTETEIAQAELVEDTPADPIEGTTAEIVHVPATSALVEPVADLATIEQAYKNYTAMCGRLLDKGDWQKVAGKRFVKKSGWRKLAVAMGVSVEILNVDTVYDEDGIARSTVTARATAPNGRTMDGIGVCSVKERGFSKPEHDIPATASTRATNRACSDLFGFGEVSAEEMQGSKPYDDGPDAYPESQAEKGHPVRKATNRSTELSEAQLKMLRAKMGQWRRKYDLGPKDFPLGWATVGLPEHSADIRRDQVDAALEYLAAANEDGAHESHE